MGRALLAAVLLLASLAAPAHAQSRVSQTGYIPVGVGVELAYCLVRDPLKDPQPVVVTFSDYAPSDRCTVNNVIEPARDFAGYLRVNLRGTGPSGGAYGGFGGELDQSDMYDVVDWLVHQSVSNRKIAITGNSGQGVLSMAALRNLHPEVDTVMVATAAWDQYRELAYPGGIHTAIFAPLYNALVLRDLSTWLPGNLLSGHLDATNPAAYAQWSADSVTRVTEDDFWRARAVWPVADEIDVPVLFATGWNDILSNRGAFESFRALARTGSMVQVYGGHDGGPGVTGRYGTDLARRWLRRYLLDECNDINPAPGCNPGKAPEPPIHLWIPRNARLGTLAGDGLIANATTWPIAGTQWRRLYLSPARSGFASSIHDGTLALAPPPDGTAPTAYENQPAPAMVSDPRLAMWLVAKDFDTDQRDTERAALTFTSAPFSSDTIIAGPVTLHLWLTLSDPVTDVFARVTDVAPDGRSTYINQGQLRTAFWLDPVQSVRNEQGEIIRPWHDVSRLDPPPAGEPHEFLVEIWPIANVFKTGHRLRVILSGPPDGTAAGLPPSLSLLHTEVSRASSILLPFVAPSRLLAPTPPGTSGGGGGGGGGGSGVVAPPTPGSNPTGPQFGAGPAVFAAGRAPRHDQPGTFVAFHAIAFTTPTGETAGTFSMRDAATNGERIDVAGTVLSLSVTGDTATVVGYCDAGSTDPDRLCKIVAKDAANPGQGQDVLYFEGPGYAESGKLAAGEVTVQAGP